MWSRDASSGTTPPRPHACRPGCAMHAPAVAGLSASHRDEGHPGFVARGFDAENVHRESLRFPGSRTTKPVAAPDGLDGLRARTPRGREKEQRA